ncbi:MBL fold metallo-hydrolase [Paraburkholderia sp. IW21]|uniref:MBL fold metallo-hydrolase n=1 Tax=Paraburkholderia sp. IW21 TaxID=3242488 RepID=UPI0035210B68
MAEAQHTASGTVAELTYPFAGPPAPGQTLEVAPGVLWIRMPMPLALDHINLWAIADGAGWTVVDTGLRNAGTAEVWEDLFEGALGGRPVTRVIVTHMHPDHIGMAGWLTRRFNCRLWMTRLEYLHCRVLVADNGREAPPDAIRFLLGAGWDDTAIEGYRARFGNFGKGTYALPDSYRRLRDKEVVRIGQHDWVVVVGNGHSPEHACLWSPELKLLISGDQVLPRISSNVSVHPMEPDADPMSDWLTSLKKIASNVPDDVLVLPGHNECFHGLHARLASLAAGQEAALERLKIALAKEPRRVVDVFPALFRRPVTGSDAQLLGLATGESQACLNYLLYRGDISVDVDAGGVRWYSLCGARSEAVGS